MGAFLWKFTNFREFDGFAGQNNFRLEMHNGDGVIGAPYWRTAGFVILMNAHKANLAITRAGRTPSRRDLAVPLVLDRDKVDFNRLVRNWSLVQAVLGSKAPQEFASAFEKLQRLSPGPDLGDRLREFLEKEGIAVVRSLSKATGLDDRVIREQLMELVLGISFEASCSPRLTPNPSEFRAKSKTQRAELKKKADENKKRLSRGESFSTEHILHVRPINMIQRAKDTSGRLVAPAGGMFKIEDLSIEVVDPQRRYLKTPKVLRSTSVAGSKKDSAEAGPELRSSFVMRTDERTEFQVSIRYRVAGIPVRYTCPMQVPSRVSRNYTPSLCRLPVSGTVMEDYCGNYACRLLLKTGRVVGCELGGTNGAVVPFICAGTPCEFLVSPGWRWAAILRDVKVLHPGYRVLRPKRVSVGKSGGAADVLSDLDETTGVALPAKQEAVVDIEYSTPVEVAAIRQVYDVAVGGKGVICRLEAKAQDGWKTVFRGRPYGFHPVIRARSNRFRIVINVVKGFDLKEVMLFRPVDSSHLKQVEELRSW
jgi:hypothetical protein